MAFKMLKRRYLRFRSRLLVTLNTVQQFHCLIPDANLKFFTTYQYKVVAENKAGVGESDTIDVTTTQAEPDDVYAPEWTSENKKTITLTWKPPGKANGKFLRLYA